MTQRSINSDKQAGENSENRTGVANPWEQLQHSADTDISTVFDRLVLFLSERHKIDKGVMLVCGDEDGQLGVVSVWDERGLKAGLTLTLPAENSLFQKVVRSGEKMTLDLPPSFEGNFFERKLLVDESTSSMLLIPLSGESQVVGMIGFSSSLPGLNTISCDDFHEATAVLVNMIEATAL